MVIKRLCTLTTIVFTRLYFWCIFYCNFFNFEYESRCGPFYFIFLLMVFVCHGDVSIQSKFQLKFQCDNSSLTTYKTIDLKLKSWANEAGISLGVSTNISGQQSIGLLLFFKYVGFIFSLQSSLKNLLESKIVEFLSHSLILYSISKSANSWLKTFKKHSLCIQLFLRERAFSKFLVMNLQTLKLNIKSMSGSKILKFCIRDGFSKNF